MEAAEITEKLEQMYDDALTYHGFTNYMRDYELVVYQSVDPDPRYGLVPRHLRFLFRHCPEVTVRSTVRPDVWATSLDDRFLEMHTVTPASDGYAWGVQCQILYPGPSLVEDSPRARLWEQQIGIGFHEVIIEGNAHQISLVFSELTVEEVQEGFTPYRVVHDGEPERYKSESTMPLRPSDP